MTINSTESSVFQVPKTKGTGSITTDAVMESVGMYVWFGPRLVLADVNLKFPANSVTALIGPSGCGKSTFIRTLNRMHELIPSAALAGQVLFEGNDIYGPTVNPVDVRLRI